MIEEEGRQRGGSGGGSELACATMSSKISGQKRARCTLSFCYFRIRRKAVREFTQLISRGFERVCRQEEEEEEENE